MEKATIRGQVPVDGTGILPPKIMNVAGFHPDQSNQNIGLWFPFECHNCAPTSKFQKNEADT